MDINCLLRQQCLNHRGDSESADKVLRREQLENNSLGANIFDLDSGMAFFASLESRELYFRLRDEQIGLDDLAAIGQALLGSGNFASDNFAVQGAFLSF